MENKLRKILVISLSGAGDVLMATPLIREIKKNIPDAEIDVLVMQGNVTKELFKNNKDITCVIYFNFMKEGVIKSLEFCKQLRKRKYDLSITGYPHARIHYSILSYLIHARKRIGFNYQSQKVKWNNLFFTKTLEEDFSKHVVENNLRVLKELNIKIPENPRLMLNLSKEDKQTANEFFRKNKIKKEKSVAMHAGSGMTKNFALKRWPKERFAELCSKIAKTKDAKIILIGNEEEIKLNRKIIKLSGLEEGKQIFIFLGTINETAAILQKSKVVVSNDTIIGHLAAAVGSFVIGLFGPTSAENTGPYTKNKKIICKREQQIEPYAHGAKNITKEQAETIKKIEVEEVYESIKEKLKWR